MQGFQENFPNPMKRERCVAFNGGSVWNEWEDKKLELILKNFIEEKMK